MYVCISKYPVLAFSSSESNPSYPSHSGPAQIAHFLQHACASYPFEGPTGRRFFFDSLVLEEEYVLECTSVRGARLLWAFDIYTSQVVTLSRYSLPRTTSTTSVCLSCQATQGTSSGKPLYSEPEGLLSRPREN